MVYPPSVPPNNRTNATVTEDNHPGDHNDVADALTDIITELGNDPKGSGSSVENRLDTMDTTIDAYQEFLADSQTPYWLQCTTVTASVSAPNAFCTLDASEIGTALEPVPPLGALASPFVGAGAATDAEFYGGTGIFRFLKTGVYRVDLYGIATSNITLDGKGILFNVGSATDDFQIVGVPNYQAPSVFSAGTQKRAATSLRMVVPDIDFENYPYYTTTSYPSYLAGGGGLVPLGFDVFVVTTFTDPAVASFEWTSINVFITKIA